jgi:hypothetical protein
LVRELNSALRRAAAAGVQARPRSMRRYIEKESGSA